MPSSFLSVTDLSSFLFCPRKLWLQKVEGLREPPNKAMTFGMIRHNVFERFADVEQSILANFTKGTSRETVVDLFKVSFSSILRKSIIYNEAILERFGVSKHEAFTTAWPSILGEVHQRADLIYDFATNYKYYEEELLEKLYPKIMAELKIVSEKHSLKGIVDRIEVFPDSYIPYELKTGSMPREGVWPSHKIQIAAYCILLSEHFGKPIKEGFVRYLDYGTARKIYMNPFTESEVMHTVQKIKDLLCLDSAPDCGKPGVCNCSNLMTARP